MSQRIGRMAVFLALFALTTGVADGAMAYRRRAPA